MIVFIVLSHMFRFDESSLLLHCSDLLNLMKETKFISMEQNKKKGKGPIKAFSQPCTTGPDKAHVDATKANPIMEPMILGEVPLTGVDATCSRPLGNAGVDQHTRTPQLTELTAGLPDPAGTGASRCTSGHSTLGDAEWRGVFTAHQKEFIKIGTTQVDCKSQLTIVQKFLEADRVPIGLLPVIPCKLPNPSTETTLRWGDTLKRAGLALMDLSIEHHHSVYKECEEKLNLLHMELLNKIHNQAVPSEVSKLEHRLEIVEEVCLQEIAAHQKKVTARELGLLVKNKLVPEPPTTSVQQPKNTEGPQQEEKSEILTLLRALNERVAKLEGQEEKMKPPRPNKERKPPQYRERHQPYPPRRGRGRGRGRGGY